MKIASVEPIHISVPYTFGGPLEQADAIPWTNMETLLIKVTTDEGLVGWGESFGFSACGITKLAVERAVAPLAVGRDPADIEALMADLARKLHNYGRNGPVSFALSGLDIALWDVAGKVVDRPLYRMLGGPVMQRTPAYASLLRYGSPDLVAQCAVEAASRGYKQIKLHENRAAEVGAARRAIGPNTALMVDVNCPWTADEAIAMARQFAPFDLLWLEEPVWPPDDNAALARVRREGHVPIAAGENAGSFGDIERLIDTAHVDYLQPSIAKIGGVTEMRRIMALATARSLKPAPHSPYFGPGLIATVHVCASSPAQPPVERLYCDLEASPLGDMIDVSDGYMRVPSGAGLGLTVNDDVLAKYRVG